MRLLLLPKTMPPTRKSRYDFSPILPNLPSHNTLSHMIDTLTSFAAPLALFRHATAVIKAIVIDV